MTKKQAFTKYLMFIDERTYTQSLDKNDFLKCFLHNEQMKPNKEEIMNSYQ